MPISQHTSHKLLLKPQYIAIRSYMNPDGDYMELSETAWKEKRLYRYYKFSNNLSVTQQQRGYAQGIFVIGAYVGLFFLLYWVDLETCVMYRHYRTLRDEIRDPWLAAARKEGHISGWKYSRKKLEEMYEKELPKIAKKHDAKK
eukprot:827208_1